MPDAGDRATGGLPLADIRRLAAGASAPLLAAACAMRDVGHGARISYSRKVFIPLTKLCRDSCHYCTFAQPPRRGEPCFLSIDAMVAIAEAGRAQGCTEALFTLGDKPELRYVAARRELDSLGYANTLSYLAAAARAVVERTGLLPHLNPGVLTDADVAMLRPYAVSMGIMLETSAERLSKRGGPHFGSPDKWPAVRLATLDALGAQSVPTTTGLLIGIGETRAERIEALLHIAERHRRHGHVQEVIIQNFVAKPGTRMAQHPDAGEDELLWTIAVARLILGADANIQAPPNLAPGRVERLIAAGINDLGGISPVTIDHVNPERPWPDIALLTARLAAIGHELVQRLPVYPAWLRDAPRWLAPEIRRLALAGADGSGLVREDDWEAGVSTQLPAAVPALHVAPRFDAILRAATKGQPLHEAQVVELFEARGAAAATLCDAADALRSQTVGDEVTYVINRNINYTNICSFKCSFCAFSKGKTHAALKGRPYDLDLVEIAARAQTAWERGATEVCMQGGIHPRYTGQTYLDIVAAVRAAVPDIHIHAFSPLEISQGAQTLELSLETYLARLRDAGLNSLPGTAAEILDDDVRPLLCPDKLDTRQWLQVVETAHRIGLPTTATIMFGHVDQPRNWARHLLAIRDLQQRTGGFTEFVPLPFVAREAPIFLKGGARAGPTWREALAMHAVVRLVFHPHLPNIQTSWVKMGPDGAAAALRAGANDLGGVLMDESITRAAGARHGQQLTPARMQQLIRAAGRQPRQRGTLYQRIAGDAGHRHHGDAVVVEVAQ